MYLPPVTLVVFTGPPNITTHPMTQLITVNTTFVLTCEGTGKEPITYHWEISNINGGEWTNIGNSNAKKLAVRNLQQSERYRCIISNNAGGTKSNIATITILSKNAICM